jgi:hypothetical protein
MAKLIYFLNNFQNMRTNIYILFVCLSFFAIIESYGQQGTIVINEVMADPTPVVGLPAWEYLELFNNSNSPVSTEKWSLSINNKRKVLPTVMINPGDYLLVSGTGGASQLLQFGKTIELSGFVISNESADIQLFSESHLLIDQFNYRLSMHRKGYTNGGYSLERIDPLRLCGQTENWATSLSLGGGTPGAVNSVNANNQDNTPPEIISSKMVNEQLLEIILSEKPNLSLPLNNIFIIPPEINSVDSIKYDEKILLVKIFFKANTIQNGEIYQLKIENLKDECGNQTSTTSLDFGYFIAKKGNLLISEVLFNPFPDGAEFVEIYNNTSRKVDLSEIYWATRDANVQITNINQITQNSTWIEPNGYLAFAKKPDDVLNFYTSKCPECIMQSDKLPQLNDESGWIMILNRNMEIIDELHYSERMHNPMIVSTDGVSLERISFMEETSESGNWHSASKSVGYATPGYENSVVSSSEEENKSVTLKQQVFSPNDDGYNDNLEILLKMGEPGWVANIRIYNKSGIEIRRLANNLSISPDENIVWDGLKENNSKADLGIYVIQVELFDKEGHRKNYRLSCAVTDRLE